MREFKRLVRATVSKTLDDEGDLNLFKPAIELPNALAGIGIAGKINALSCSLHVDDATAEEIARHLIWVNRKISGNQLEQFMNSERKLIPREIRPRGNVDWDSAFATGNLEELGKPGWAHLYGEDRVAPAPTVVFFRCPNIDCGKLQASSAGSFKRCDLDSKTKCRFCLKQSAIKLWLCDCQREWHSCELHRSYYRCKHHEDGPRSHNTDAENNSRSSIIEQPKRGCGDIARGNPFEAMLAADVKKARRKTPTGVKRKADSVTLDGGILSKRPTLLGPILGQRFPSASSSML